MARASEYDMTYYSKTTAGRCTTIQRVSKEELIPGNKEKQMQIETKLIGAEDCITTEWSGGKTTQLFIYPEDSNYQERNFKFRLSSATVETETSEFTKLPGVHRFITPLDKELKLTHDHKRYIHLNPFEVYAFAGGQETTSYGTARDFNLMLRDGANGQLAGIHIDKEQVLTEAVRVGGEGCFYFIYACNNEVHIELNGHTAAVKPAQTLFVRAYGEGRLNIKIGCMGTADILTAKICV